MKCSIVKPVRIRHRNRRQGVVRQPAGFHLTTLKVASAFKKALKKNNTVLMESLILDIEHIISVVSGDLLLLVNSDSFLNQSFGKDYALIIQILEMAESGPDKNRTAY